MPGKIMDKSIWGMPAFRLKSQSNAEAEGLSRLTKCLGTTLKMGDFSKVNKFLRLNVCLECGTGKLC